MKTAKTKESKKVLEARRKILFLNHEIEFTQKKLEQLYIYQREAKKMLLQELSKADEHLPQATLWRENRVFNSSKPKQLARVVILRQTPSGQLVCRLAGSENTQEIRFKFKNNICKFCIVDKYSSDYLLDVPEQYILAATKQNAQVI